jgi:hypothetical protein
MLLQVRKIRLNKNFFFVKFYGNSFSRLNQYFYSHSLKKNIQ